MSGLVLKMKSEISADDITEAFRNGEYGVGVAQILKNMRDSGKKREKFAVVMDMLTIDSKEHLQVRCYSLRNEGTFPLEVCERFFDVAYNNFKTFMEEEDLTVCEHCNTLTSKQRVSCLNCGCIRGSYVKIDHLGYLIIEQAKCDICGEMHPKNHMSMGLSVDRQNKNVCQKCRNSGRITRCSVCSIVTEHYHEVTFTNSDKSNVCDDCYKYMVNYDYLCECGAMCALSGTTTKSQFTGVDGKKMCAVCYSQKYLTGTASSKYSYHNYDGGWFDRKTESDRENEFKVGFELEVERDSGELNEVNCIGNISAHLNGVGVDSEDANVIFMRDGSLRNGFEIISHPMTISYMKQTEIIDKMCYILDSYGCKSHDTETCGLHLHISKDYLTGQGQYLEDVLDRIHIIFETFKRELKLFSRRGNSSIAEWCNFLTDRASVETVTLSSVKKAKNEAGNLKYVAVNANHNETIEFRIFRGTTYASTIKATIELVKAICDIAKDVESDIDGLTWAKILDHNPNFNGYLKSYVQDRRITSNTVLMVSSHFENNKDYYTVENFIDGKFTIALGDDEMRLKIFLASLRAVLVERDILNKVSCLLNKSDWVWHIKHNSLNELGNYIQMQKTQSSSYHTLKGYTDNGSAPIENGKRMIVSLEEIIEHWWG